MSDTLKIKVRTGDVRRVIVMNLGEFDSVDRTWKMKMDVEFVQKLVEAFHTPEVKAAGVEIVFESAMSDDSHIVRSNT